MTVPVIFQILCPARTAPKRLGREPLWTLGDQRKYPLDSSRSGDSRLSAQTNSGLPAFRLFGRNKVWVQSCPRHSFSSNSRNEIAVFTRLAYFNCRLAPDLDW